MAGLKTEIERLVFENSELRRLLAEALALPVSPLNIDVGIEALRINAGSLEIDIPVSDDQVTIDGQAFSLPNVLDATIKLNGEELRFVRGCVVRFGVDNPIPEIQLDIYAPTKAEKSEQPVHVVGSPEPVNKPYIQAVEEGVLKESMDGPA